LDGSGNSVIDTSLVGFVDGIGGTFNNFNHPGYSNDVCMVANFGGAMGDISWMNNIWPKVPVASLHCRKDLFSPIDSGNVVVPATGQVVVFVHGSRTVVRKAVQQGLNDIWVNHTFTDPYSLRAYQLNPALTNEGLFQFEIADIPSSTNQEAAPWEWWDSTASTQQAQLEGSVYALAVHGNGIDGNPNMSATKARLYCDTIVGFLIPRMYLVLNNPTLSTENQLAVDYSIFPNPMMDQLTIQVGNNDMIKNMMVVDMNGKTLVTFKDVNSNYYVLNRNGLSAGTYMVHVTTQLGSFVHKIMLQ
jgi:hypothetical protein